MSAEGNKPVVRVRLYFRGKAWYTNRGITRVFAGGGEYCLALIGVAVATRRASVLGETGRDEREKESGAGLDEHFAREKTLTLLHVLPGMIFMILGAAAIRKGTAGKASGGASMVRADFLTASAVIGVTGIDDGGARNDWRGRRESGNLHIWKFLFGRAWQSVVGTRVNKEFAKHREWMIRGYAVGACGGNNPADHGGILAIA